MKHAVGDIMIREVRTVKPRQTLVELETVLQEANVSGLPVVEEARLVGMASRSDIVRQLLLERDLAMSDVGLIARGFHHEEVPADIAIDLGDIVGERLERIRVRDVMNRKVESVSPELPIREAAELIVRRKIHRLPVVDQGRLVGLVSVMDLARLIADGVYVPNTEA